VTRRVAIVTVVVIASGCVSTSPRYLDDLLADRGEMIQGGVYRVGPDLAPAVRPEDAKEEIRRFLERDPRALPTKYDNIEHLRPSLRARDYWALVYARLAGATLELRDGDDDVARDARISAMLAAAR
jgi:hypothetical protein